MRCGRVLLIQLGVLVASIFVAGVAGSSSSSASSSEEKQDFRYLGSVPLHHTPSPTRAPTNHPVTPQPTNGPNTDVDVVACFSSVATVTVMGKKMGLPATTTKTMSELEVGDVILADDHGHFSMVYAFGHYAPDKRSEFLQIHYTTPAASATTATTPLEMTKEHLVFLHDQIHPVRADALKVGNVLLRDDGSVSSVGATITKIDRIWKTGLYAPLTQVGTLVVNGIVASSYVSFQDDQDDDDETSHKRGETGVSLKLLGLSQHDYVHMGLSPFRLVCTTMMMMSSTRPGFCSINDNNDGMPSYVAFAVALNQWAQAQHWVVELSVLLAVVVLTGSCWMLECFILGATTDFSGAGMGSRMIILIITMIMAGMLLCFGVLQKTNYHIRIQRTTTTSTVHPIKTLKCA